MFHNKHQESHRAQNSGLDPLGLNLMGLYLLALSQLLVQSEVQVQEQLEIEVQVQLKVQVQDKLLA